jgi:hypothetical protein
MIGLAAVSAIAASSTTHYLHAHAVFTASSSAVALDHGFQTALYALTGLLLLGALIAATLIKPPQAASAPIAGSEGEVVALEEAA